MVYANILQFILVAAVVFIIINVMTPFLYNVWYNNLTPQVKNSTELSATKMVNAGNNLFITWQIMGYLVPGIIIAYGFATAARTGTREQEAFDEG